MTRNPIFVTSDSLAIEALQKMVQGELYIFSHFFLKKFVVFIFGGLLKLVICYKLKSA
jgi:CBS domain-containing protein